MNKKYAARKAYINAANIYPTAEETIDFSLVKKLREYVLGISDECITLDDVLYVFSLSDGLYDISRGAGINISMLFPIGFENYRCLFKELYDNKEISKKALDRFLRGAVASIQEKDPSFELHCDLSDIDYSRGWEIIYDVLFKGFTYTISLPKTMHNVKKNEWARNRFVCEVTSTDAKIDETKHFKEVFNYDLERLEEVNNVFKNAVNYIRENDLLIKKSKAKTGKAI